jgi:hypothetical protein
MEPPVLVQAGVRNARSGRAGDFSGISVDTDDTFWIANEFANTELIANWGTAIAQFTVLGPPVPPPAKPRALEGIGQQFGLGSFVDTNPGSSGTWVNREDNTPNTVFVTSTQGSPGSGRHADAEVGSYTVTVTVTDGLNLVGSATYPPPEFQKCRLLRQARQRSGRQGRGHGAKIIAEEIDHLTAQVVARFTPKVIWLFPLRAPV